MARLRGRIMSMRKECVRLTVEQGEALHKFMTDAETKDMMQSRLPQGSDQRLFYEVCCDALFAWDSKRAAEAYRLYFQFERLV